MPAWYAQLIIAFVFLSVWLAINHIGHFPGLTKHHKWHAESYGHRGEEKTTCVKPGDFCNAEEAIAESMKSMARTEAA